MVARLLVGGSRAAESKVGVAASVEVASWRRIHEQPVVQSNTTIIVVVVVVVITPVVAPTSI